MLDTKYKDDKFAGKRKYQMMQNDDGTYSFDDVTNYDDVGTEVGAADFNEINEFLLEKVYPIGSIYISTVDKNPADILGFGAWERFAEGRTVVGAGTGTDENGTTRTFAGGSKGGEYTHQLTVNEIPSHSHTQFLGGPITTTNAIAGNGVIGQSNNSKTSSIGNDENHNNVSPFTSCFIYKRIQ